MAMSPSQNSESLEVSKVLKDHLRKCKEISYINAGSTAYTFFSEHEHVGRQVIKIAKPSELKNNPNLHQMFLDEVSLLSSVKHRNVVEIYDLDEISFDGLTVPYYLMEYFPSDLQKFISSENFKNLSREEFISMYKQIIEGLHCLHNCSPPLCHNDIKEGNIFVSSDLTVKVGDFGFSKHVRDSPSIDSQHGTPEYWCEELCLLLKDKKDQDPNNTVVYIQANERKTQWDIHALGCVYSNLLTKYCENSDNRSRLGNADKRYLEHLIEEMKQKSDDDFCNSGRVLLSLNDLALSSWSNPRVSELSTYPRSTVRLPEQQSVYLSEKVKLIVNHPWFQRLKNVRQLALAHLVYPGAMHTRLEHSLGVYNQTAKYINALMSDEYNPFMRLHFHDYEQRTLLLAALLHDIGHYPFAHAFEDLSFEKFSHARFSRCFIDGSITSYAPALQEIASTSPKQFIDIIKDEWKIDPNDLIAILGNDTSPNIKDPICRIMRYILDSPIDADKIDYIRRDALHVGVTYGRSFDVDRFLQGVTIDENDNKIILLEKAKVPAEMLLMARYAMFKDVYKHHTVRVAESMLNHAVDLFFRSQESELNEEANLQNFYNTLFMSSDDEIIDWLQEKGDDDVKAIIERIKRRQMFKRLVVYKEDDENTSTLFQKIVKLKWTMKKEDFHAFYEQLRLDLSTTFDINLSQADLVIDVPNPNKETIEEIFVLPEYSNGAVSMYAHSDIWKLIQDNFKKWVHKVRIFVEEEKRNEIYKISAQQATHRQPNFDKINLVVESAVNNIWNSRVPK